MKKLLSIILCLSIILSLCCYSVSATVDFSYKIDDFLVKKLELLEDNQLISVSVWYNDIDYNEVYENVYADVNTQISKNKMNSYMYDLLISDLPKSVDNLELRQKITNKSEILKNLSATYSVDNEFNLATEIDENVLNSDIEYLIGSERKFAKEMYQKQNGEIFDLIPNVDSNRIIYISKYSPSVNLYLTKEEINQVAQSSTVDTIYYYDKEAIFIDTQVGITPLYTTATIDEETTTENVNFDITGIEFAQNIWGLYGSGIKIGVWDEFSNSNTIDYLNLNNIDFSNCKNGTLLNSYTTHGNDILSILVGEYRDSDGSLLYLGAVPGAEIYASSGYSMEETFERFIDKGCSVITASVGIANMDGYYTAQTRWTEHLSQHNVHLVFSAGNNGASGTTTCGFGYNTITVGACYNDGSIYEGTSYETSATDPYKPDLVAPGHEWNFFPSQKVGEDYTFVRGCTSYSTPIVAAVVAQLCEANPTLSTNPTLMKSLVLSSCELTEGMKKTYTNAGTNVNNQIALHRRYGAGMVNVQNANYIYKTRPSYITGITDNTTSVNTFTKTINYRIYSGYTSEDYITRFCLVMNADVSLSEPHEDNVATDVHNNRLKMTITTPSGKIYRSNFEYDTKQYITIRGNESGTYTFTIEQIQNNSSLQNISYAITYMRKAREAYA